MNYDHNIIGTGNPNHPYNNDTIPRSEYYYYVINIDGDYSNEIQSRADAEIAFQLAVQNRNSEVEIIKLELWNINTGFEETILESKL